MLDPAPSTRPDARADARAGVVAGVLAYGLWGVVPAFWKLLRGVDPVELLAHRAWWGLGCFAALLALTGQLGAAASALRTPRTVAAMAISAALLAVNWGTFVWAVVSDHLLAASLGYFINPLVSVALGVLFLGERPRPGQWLAIGLAAVGVTVMAVGAGALPWVSLLLAGTFGVYGLVRKQAAAPALVGSAVETVLLAPIALVYLGVLAAGGGGQLGHATPAQHLLLIATGVITAVPLVLFAAAARRLPLATVGLLQYLAPTGQFVLAVVAYGEPLRPISLAAFACIWAALLVFTIDAWRAR